MLTVIVTGVCVVVAGGTTTADADKELRSSNQVQTTKPENKCNKWEIVKGIRFYRASMWMWQWMEGVTFSRVTKWRPKHSCAFLQYLGIRARERSLAARRSFERWFHATLAKYDCIHRHEAAWNGDNNSTYDGGLQMDDGFESTYGSDFIKLWGHDASNWPVWAQLRAAERAYHGYGGHAGRGFGPWPTHAAYCA